MVEYKQADLLQQALSLHRAGHIDQAKAIYLRIAQAEPRNPDLLRLIGTAAYQLGDVEECVLYLSRSVEIFPEHPETRFNLAIALSRLNRHEESLFQYHATLMLRPNHAEAYFNRGNLLKEMDRLEEAISSYDNALTIRPNYAKAAFNHGGAMAKLGRLEHALVSYEQAIASQYNYTSAHYCKAEILTLLKRFSEAIASLDRAIEIQPEFVDAYHLKSVLLSNLMQSQEALKCIDQAIEIQPNFAKGYHFKGAALTYLGRVEEGLACFEMAFSLSPRSDYLLGDIIHGKAHIGCWEHFRTQVDLLTKELSAQRKIVVPFIALSLVDDPQLHKAAAELYMTDKHPGRQLLPPLAKKSKSQRLKIGYFSSDFSDHPVSHLLAGMFERHDRKKFEIHCFSFGPKCRDAWRDRIAGSVEHFIDVHSRSDREITSLARTLDIDIAVDLNGLSGDARPDIFAERAAPIQLSYLGYLGTLGTRHVDYLVADPMIVPPSARENYSEKILYLSCYQCNDDKQKISNKPFYRTEFGLPEDKFVYCSFNNNYKITPENFDLWASILKAAPRSVLWLYASNKAAVKNLRLEAEKRAVDPDRLIFANRTPLEDHLARLKLADLFLDTHPYNAGATASNALRVGLPVLTRAGKSFASRIGASLLTATRLPELIANSDEEYTALAVRLACEPSLLTTIKSKLAQNLATCPLFDTERFTQNMEAAYEAAYTRYHNGLVPDHIDLSAVV
ncbi:tetratricopeptide repeat protein [Microvirga puerhi]|uniref:protein O-GlcNAc transferase n=1 Tax=Microvirga puerhi TaxID=2876078 RepID=A0ABS7VJ63_9HYPH|nr:tetratricopeptide repeat protein [Microvirga puerhi]MBZ6075087.1 tetratricopeptide repeat protein [Microvirga puerhi]